MLKNLKEIWETRSAHVMVGLTVLALLVAICLFVVIAKRMSPTTEPEVCNKLCRVTYRLDKARDENIDLRVKVQKLETALLEKDEKKTYPPDSRHFYNCKPPKKRGDWNLALYSNTTNQLWVYECMSWRGHTSPQYMLPEAERKKVTCTDTERGVTYPYDSSP